MPAGNVHDLCSNGSAFHNETVQLKCNFSTH